MTRPVEDRLRAAYAARARRVGEDALVRRHPDPTVQSERGRAGHGRFPWLTPLAAAASVLLLLGVGWAVGPGRPGATAPQQTPATAPVASSPSRPSSTSDQPRSAIPWDTVGQGWAVAVVVTHPASAGSPASGTTLLLVSPQGQRYAVAGLGQPERVLDVSPDGHRALLSAAGSVVEWDLAAGTSRVIPLPEQAEVRYTKPLAKALILTVGQDTNTHIERRALDGSLLLTVPVDRGWPQGMSDPVMTPDGLDVVVSTGTGLALLGNATGVVVRSYPPPAGYQRCAALRVWDARAPSMLVRCTTTTDPSVSNLWAYPVDGSAPSPLTLATAAHSPGFWDAWPLRNGAILQSVSDSCTTTGPLGLLNSSGLADPPPLGLASLSSSAAMPAVLAVVGDTAYLTLDGCGGELQAPLYTVDLATGQAGTLIGTGTGEGAVASAVVITASR
jgi:hypothetical protein